MTSAQMIIFIQNLANMVYFSPVASTHGKNAICAPQSLTIFSILPPKFKKLQSTPTKFENSQCDQSVSDFHLFHGK
jgi:hypothetical protein